MKETLKKIISKIKSGALQEMYQQTVWIYQYAKKYWKFLVVYTLLGLLETALSLIASIISKNLVDVVTGHHTSLLLSTFALYVGFSLGNIIAVQISNYASNWISIKVNNEIKADVFDKMLVTDWESLTAYHTGDLLTRWSYDASTISDGILSWIPNLVIYTIRFLSTFAVVIFYDPTFALLAMISIPVSIFMSRSLMSKMQSNNKRSAAMNSKLSGFNQESFSNIQTLKAFDMLPVYSARLKQLQKDFFNVKMDFQKLQTITSIIMSFVGMGVSFLCYGWGIYRVWTGAISYGTMTMFLGLSTSLNATLNSLIGLVPTAIGITTSAGRLMDILNMPKENFEDAPLADQLLSDSRSLGLHLSIENIDYRYHNGTEVFRNASFVAHPREIVALVGPSGEGKTTMLRLILALLQPQSGSCRIGTAAQSLSLSPATRRLFSYVPQGNTMFSGTIAENMQSVKPNVSDAEIIEALQLSCAWDFVSKLPDGIHSMVGERGGGFSEGQSQRLSIARALLRRSPVLLLDEATSALDVTTERRVLKNIMQDDYPRICIVTTHRPTVLTLCNRVYGIFEKKCRELTPADIDKLIQDF